MKIFLLIAIFFSIILTGERIKESNALLKYMKFKNTLYADQLERNRDDLDRKRNTQIKRYIRDTETSQMKRNLLDNKRNKDLLKRSQKES